MKSGKNSKLKTQYLKFFCLLFCLVSFSSGYGQRERGWKSDWKGDCSEVKILEPGLDVTGVAVFKNRLFLDAKKDNIKLWITSGFRSYSLQTSLYNNYVLKDGKEKADTYSARPGHSEHQTGLAMDLNIVDSSFEGTKEAIWIADNCYKYGFIIRYPKGKEEITGYKYEPWHVRYLGKELSEKVYKSGKTLEEYLNITSKYSE